MLYIQIIIITVLALYLLAAILVSFKYGIAVRFHFLSAVIGLVIICMLKVTQSYTGIDIPINIVTLSFGACGPLGVIFYFIIYYLFL